MNSGSIGFPLGVEEWTEWHFVIGYPTAMPFQARPMARPRHDPK